MPTIIQRNGRYLARVRREGFTPVAKTFTKKADALTWGRRVELDMEAGRWKERAAEVPTLAQAIKQYKQAVLPSMKGAAFYGYTLDELSGIDAATKPIDKVHAADVVAWRDSMAARGLAAGTIVRRLGLLSGLMTWAHKERGWVSSNPVHSVRKPRVNDSRDRVLTVEERGWLIEGARAGRCDWLADALTVLLETAMRRSELWGLCVDRVDLARSVARLDDTKNGSPRFVPLTSTATEALSRLAAKAASRGREARARGAQDAPAPRAERLIPVSDAPAVSLAFRRALKRAQALYSKRCAAEGVEPDKGFLEGVRLHDCRHTAVTHWAATGALSVHELQALSGHKTVSMLSRYVNLRAEDLAKKLNRVAATQAAAPHTEGAAA